MKLHSKDIAMEFYASRVALLWIAVNTSDWDTNSLGVCH